MLKGHNIYINTGMPHHKGKIETKKKNTFLKSGE